MSTPLLIRPATHHIQLLTISVMSALIALAALLLLIGQPPTVQARFNTGLAPQPPLTANTWIYTAGVNCGPTIQACIDSASNGDTVIVPAGIYTESLTLSKAVSLTGVSSATTIIRATGSQRVLTVTGDVISNSVIITGMAFANGDAAGGTDCPENCGGGILITGTAQPLIQDVVVANNRTSWFGGGIYAHTGSPLTLTNVSVLSNSASGGGGGIYALSALTLSGAEVIGNTSLNSFGGGVFANDPAILTGGRFERNAALGSGGGLYARDTLTLSGTEFFSNTAPDGAGMYVFETAVLSGGRFVHNIGSGLHAAKTLTLTGTEFINNTGGGVSASGAVIMNNGRLVNNLGGGLSTWGTLTLNNTDFISNTGIGGGGARAYGAVTLVGGRFVSNLSTSLGMGAGGLLALDTLTVTGTEFISNTAWGNGGGVIANGEATLISSRFMNNRSTQAGGNAGGLYAYSTLTITDTEFIGNTARQDGGGVYQSSGTGRLVNVLFARNAADGNGAGLYLGSVSTTVILHTTIADVTLNPRQAIYVTYSGTVGVTNTIIVSHSTGIGCGSGTVYEDYNLYFGNTINLTGTIASGGHSQNGNPAFVNLASDNYHLGLGSAIDTGIDVGVTADFDGQPRPLNNGFDIGYDEYSGAVYHAYLPLVFKTS